MICGPLREIVERAAAERAFLRQRLFGTTQALAVLALVGRRASGGNRPKLTFIGWNDLGPASMVSDMAAGDVAEERAERGRRRRRGGARPAFRGREAAGQEPDGGDFDITLDAGDLAGEAQARLGLEPELAVEQLRAVEKVLRWRPPRRANSARSRPGMVRKMRTCSACFSLVWKPTMLKSVPSALSWRSCTTA